MIYTKTALGQQVFQRRDNSLSQRARSVLIMIDGVRDEDTLLRMFTAIGAGADQLDELLSAGLIEPTTEKRPTVKGVAPKPAQAMPQNSAGGALTDQERYQLAYPIATKLTSGLGLRGFRLNLSVESAGNLADLQALAPKIREAVGQEKYMPLQQALGL
jgi:hypothetical protein